MKEGLMILDLMKNIKNQYVKANLEQKSENTKSPTFELKATRCKYFILLE